MARKDAKTKEEIRKNACGVENPYLTAKEAGDAAIKLGISCPMTYRKKREADPRLPIDPPRYYSDFTTWKQFLNCPDTYKTLGEAELSIRNLGIRGHTSYLQNRHLDPRLPADAWNLKGFLGWKNHNKLF